MNSLDFSHAEIERASRYHRPRYLALAIDLLCWMRLLLFDADLAKAEPATLRYRLLHAAARLVRRSRYVILRVPETWPWAQDFADAVNRVRAIP